MNFYITTDEQGLKFFAFQGNINKKLKLNQLGEISGEVYRKENEKWIIENRNINIVSGDIIHYWIYIQVNEAMHISGEQTWTGFTQYYIYSKLYSHYFHIYNFILIKRIIKMNFMIIKK